MGCAIVNRMKNTSTKFVFTLLTVLLMAAGASSLWADGTWDSRHHYRRDNYGYWDEHNHYNHYVMYHHHHGYWDTRGPVRVFINVD
jgi:hypothetical protein